MRLLHLAAVFATIAAPALASGIPVTDCDRLAGFDMARRLPGAPGVAVVSRTDDAVPACEAAMAAHPDEPFFRLLLARALIAADGDAVRILSLIEAGGASYPALAHAQMAWLYQEGRAGFTRNLAQARARFEDGCALHPDPLAAAPCNALAVMEITGEGGPADPAAGVAMLQELCSKGFATACANLGYELGPDGALPRDAARAAGLFTTACALGDLMGCNNLGFAYESGDGVAVDMARALILYGRACEGGEPLGCANLGEAYRVGNGIGADAVIAAEYFDRACDSEDAYSCFALAGMLSEGAGLSVDGARALALYDRACALGDDESCALAEAMR
ncbi:MAG: sel1 repeat family protein [Rhodobacter sp.]|nr:sel1 repeat family protein [Paracoccaceae bacterium]MCC0076397.1 sel1 repeat family protein [Rhodobacter sp.]